MSPLDLLAGSLFAEDFQIVRRLGVGDNGAVYVVEHITTGAERALKVVAPHVAPDEASRLAFEREARVGAQIESDHVVLVVGAGLDPKTKMAWVAMELLDGVDLAARVAGGAPMPQTEVALLAAHLCEALGAAHEVGITHGDVKPTNVFLAKPRAGDAPFDAKVLDFGVAKLTVDPASAAAGVRGTPLWMAPEQASAGGEITPATDVWAIALLTFFALTGRSYWRAAGAGDVDLAALLAELTSTTKASASERAAELGVGVGFPDGFDAWFARCLAIDPGARFANANAAYAVLGKVLGQASRPPEAKPAAVAAPPKVPEGLVRTQNRPMSDYQWFSPDAPKPPLLGTKMGSLPPSAFAAANAPPPAPAFAPPITPLPPLPPPAAPAASTATWKIVATIVVVALAASLVTLAYLKRSTPVVATPAPVASPSVAAPAPSPVDTGDTQVAIAAASASAAVAESPLVPMQGGAFTLGLPLGAASEHAKATVAPFAIEQHEVTVSAYAKCVAAGHCSAAASGSMCLRASDDNGKKPVNCVSYRQAAGYCAWIGRRLPTEAEWELAAAGRAKRPYPWARTTPPASGDLCWQRCKTSEGPCDVGAYPRGKTPEGLDDMAGNVSEWTSSPYCPYDKPDCGAASRVTRGGGWCDDDPNAIKTTTREANDPTEASASLGFRCAADL